MTSMPIERKITYADAIREALDQIMESDPKVVLFGLDVDDPKRIQGTTAGLLEKYGPERVFGTPVAEDAMTGIAIGMARAGLHPIHNHIRMDFNLLTMNQMINIAAKTRFMTGGQESVPMVVRTMIGKSWGQGAQHSQALHSLFAHIPGLSVVMPTTPYDAKGCLIAAVQSGDPVIYIEHRLLHFQKGIVPNELYSVKPKTSRVSRVGKDITLVGISYMQVECLRAAEYLKDAGIDAEVIDPIWISPLDDDTICRSASKTGRLLVVDNGWVNFGVGAEIIARVAERGFSVRSFERMGFAPTPCPPSPTLENEFYPSARKIASRALYACTGKYLAAEERDDLKEIEFKGPF